MHLLVSIITATRNRKNLLERLIKSIITQKYPHIEHIVVDGLSSDGTQELLKFYESKYNLHWISEKDKNQIEAINKGLKMAKGEYITITHDDDYWLPDGIDTLMKEFIDDPSPDLVYGDSYALFPDGHQELVRYGHYTLNDMVNIGYQLPQHGSIFKSKWLNELGFLNELIEYVAEYELFLRIIQTGGKYKYIPKVVGVGLQHNQKKSWVGWDRSWDETWYVNRQHGGKLFSKFTLIYLKNRYFLKPVNFIKKHLPGFFRLLLKIFKPPSYSKL